jgi:hypothetical protein
MLDDAGDLDGSERARELALAGFREVGDRWGVAMTLAMQANAHSLRGHHDEAIAGYQQGLAMARELSSDDDSVQQLSRLATERMRVGDQTGAWRDMREAQRIAESSGQLEHEAIARFTLLDLARRAGDFEEAHGALDWLAAVADRLPFPMRMSDEWVAVFGASLAVSEGDVAFARENLPSAIRLSSNRRDMPDVATAAQVGARLLAFEGEFTRAAWALGVSKAARGAFDHGDPELAELIEEITAEIGKAAFETAYRDGADLSKEDAIAGLCAEFGV